MSEIDDIYIIDWNEQPFSSLAAGNYIRGYTIEGEYFEGQLSCAPHVHAANAPDEWQLCLKPLGQLPQREVTAKITVEVCTSFIDSSDRALSEARRHGR